MTKEEARSSTQDSPLFVIFYIVYVIANILTLGTFWFLRNLITYGVYTAMSDQENEKNERKKYR